MIDEINSLGRGLTAWEEGFMIDITDQWERTRALTDHQQKILDTIYEERV
jgi:hypothetical protein